MTKSLSPSEARKLVNRIGKSPQEKGKDLEDAVKDFLNLHNCEYQRVTNYRCFNCGQVQNAASKGWPDYFVYKPFILAIECKAGNSRLSKDQKKVKRWLEKGGIDYIVVRNTVDRLISYFEERKINK